MKYFKKSEFRMGNENVYAKMDVTFLISLDELRELVKEPLIITSSYRSVEYNRAIGGAKRSMHLKGKAVDVVCLDGILRRKIVQHALSLGMTCGVAGKFIHIDNRSKQIIFTY